MRPVSSSLHGEQKSTGNPKQGLLGGSWVVISRVSSRVTILKTHIKGLITPLITTPKPYNPAIP